MNIDINLVALGLSSFIAIIFIAISARLKLKLNKSIEISSQLWFDRTALQEELDKLSFINSNSNDIENGFIKFLSESREQAFSYIEDVQVAIMELNNAVQLGDEETITKAYMTLTNFLPSENQDVVK